MVRGLRLKEADIGAIAALSKAGHLNIPISKQTGIPLSTVQMWTKRFRDNGYRDITPLHKKSPGPAHKLGPRTLTVLKREVDKSPGILAHQLKEKNP